MIMIIAKLLMMIILWKFSIPSEERRRMSKVHPSSSQSCAPEVSVRPKFKFNADGFFVNIIVEKIMVMAMMSVVVVLKMKSMLMC